ncbi:MAG TPA: kelch repeat-containing protein [Nitrospinota bacterium]|nr:kelch repeat-containing protein [Nitrospinota bacterium]
MSNLILFLADRMKLTILKLISGTIFITILVTYTTASGQSLGSWTIKAPAPTKRTEVAVAAIGKKIYVAGGFGRLGVTSRVEEYDTTTDSWRELSPMPKRLHHAGIGVVNGKLYIVGGFGGTFSWMASNAIYEYDPVTDRWRTRSPMLTARGALAVGVHQGKLYAIGGYAKGQNVSANEWYVIRKKIDGNPGPLCRQPGTILRWRLLETPYLP